MGLVKIKYRSFIVSLLFILGYAGAFGQSNVSIIIKGMVTDAQTNEPIPFTSVGIVTKNLATMTNLDGHYTITFKGAAGKIKFSCVGYESATLDIAPGKSQIINVKLKPSVTALNEVVIRPSKIKYKNKNNPAVELIEKVIENKSKNRKEGLDYFEYEKYEKTQFALSNFNEKLKQRRAFKKFQFVFDNIDSTKVAGSKILPVYLKETLSDYYYRKSPKASKEIIKANKMASFEGYIDNQGMTEYLKYLYQDINIYDNNISFLTNQFLSPIANSAPTFYRFYIMDTALISGSKCVKLLFSPRNKTDMLFQGFMYITLDSAYVVKKIDMSVNKDINLNWVKDVNIVQEFDQIQEKGWLLTTDEISIDFGISKNSMGIYGQKMVSYKNYKVNEPREENDYKGLDLVQNNDANKKTNNYWKHTGMNSYPTPKKEFTP